MGRREAWSAERSSNSRTKPTHWEFRRRDHHTENVDTDNYDESGKRVRSADEKRSIRIKYVEKKDQAQVLKKAVLFNQCLSISIAIFRNNFKDTKTAKETQFHNSRTNLINEREVYADDTDHELEQIKRKHIDDDSMRRHEIDRGSDIEYDPQTSLKRQTGQDDGHVSNRDQYFIKDGNAEILRLITRGKNDEENIYVNIPPQHPQYIMVENSGKEILMKRFIDEQANGKHIVREHYQIIPTTMQQQKLGDDMPNAQHVSEIYVNKSQPGSLIYSQPDPNQEVKLIHTNHVQSASHLNVPDSQMQHAYSNSSIHQELENSLKQQNALLRQILLEKEKLQEKYSQQEIALETQSLPGHSMAIATQTDCEAGTQTENASAKPLRRRARSENDDSMSEDEYEYVRYSPPNSPEGVYWIKRRKHKKKTRNRASEKPRKRMVMVEEIKRKIRTPIKEENEDFASQSPPRNYLETKTSLLRRLKNGTNSHKHGQVNRSAGLKKDVLMEISDSFDEQHRQHPDSSSYERRKNFQKSHTKQIEYYDESDEDSDNDIVIRRNNYSADSLEDEYTDSEEMTQREKRRNYRNIIFSRQGSSTDAKDAIGYPVYDSDGRRYIAVHSVTSTPASKRMSRKDSTNDGDRHRRYTTSEPPHRSNKGPAPKPPEPKISKKVATRSETDLMHRMREDGYEITKHMPAPRYMEWYYNKSKESDLEKKRHDEYRNEKEKSKVSNKKLVGGIEKRIKSKASRFDEQKFKPEPLPRTTPPPKGARMLKEDVQLNKTLAPKIQTDSNHPLLQYSEHRYEHEYNPAPDIPVPPTKLPHYMYPETPPLASVESRNKSKGQKQKPKPSPIRENEVKESSSRHSSQTDINANHNVSKQLNASTLEDDHDSGIAMNSLLHSLGKRNPIADKKSVFTIAYDEAKIKRIQSESDSPQFS